MKLNPNNEKYINIIFCADKNYAKVIGVSMISVLKNLSKDKIARFFIFSQGFKQKDLEKLDKIKTIQNCEIINIPMEQHLGFFDFVDVSKFKNNYITVACYFRLLIFKILPDYIETCFFVDGDMIVETDLSKISLSEGKIFKAVVESQAMYHRKKILSHLYKMPEFAKFKENPLKYPYFNAGFFYTNIEKCKELNIFEEIEEFLKNNPAPPYADQDTLNAIFGQKHSDLIEFLPLEFNVFTDINYSETFDNLPYNKKELMYAVKNPKIIHYGGSRKPWNNINGEVLYINRWWKYYKFTPWGKDYLIQIVKIFFKNLKLTKKFKLILLALKLK